MEYTGHYHYPVLKKLTDEHFPVCLVNPYQMKKYGDTELRRSKTDKKDAIRIATYALEKSYQLVPYSVDDQKYVDYQQSIFSKFARSNHAGNHIHSPPKEQRP